MILDEKVEIRIGSKNIKYLEEKGYEIPRYYDKKHKKMSIRDGTTIWVNIDDLSENSHIKVNAICDNCGKPLNVTYQGYKKCEHPDGKRYCNKCASNLITKQVWLDKYGVDCSLRSPEIMEKVKKTNMERYGAENTFASEIIKEKIRQKNLSNLGVEYPMQSPLVQEKSKQTCIDKYGVEYILQSTEIRQRICETLSMTDKVPTSTQQRQIYNELNSYYDKEDVIINYPLSNVILDIRLDLCGQLFDIEYDCYYWHKDKQKYDRKRDEFVKSQGYRVLRIKSGHKIPELSQIIEKIEFMISNDYHYSEIVLDDWKLD